ncbi:DUF1972 domain-containing protein [Grimontia kaedaensis]|uniref:DUF1972 domain-containing protein n=1 Tax=Grimontia kaedaensis TaxID=2872157 RepID=A0ABY4WUM1_9GAMM|nr:DUF1972 domain-containing protein [Grimontia kaedaensis]USH03294.1 DUF1972 domain-containing protein [Grimontia kaedaensis]
MIKLKSKKVSIVGTVGIPACYGGFESLVENLTLHKSKDVDYYVFCSSKVYKKKLDTHNDAELVYLSLKANGVQSILYDILSLVKCIKIKPDVVLILGVSGCVFLPFFKLLSNSKVITNIDGLEWKREKWPTAVKAFLKFSERMAVKYSDIIVTDNKAIGDYVDTEYRKKNHIIAYGGDHAIRDVDVDISDITNVRSEYALGLCRIEPENNVEMILEAFSNNHHLIKFVGNWEASAYGISLKEKFGKFPNIELLDPIYDLDSLYSLRVGCSLYLHGHSAGGTNPSLVEMMHFGIPIFAFDCDFNRFSTNNSAHFFKDTEQLIDLVASTNRSELDQNGKKMKKLATERYTWKVISSDYESLYS